MAKHNIPYYPTTTKNGSMANDYGYKQDNYATTVDTDEIGDLSERLQKDLRKHVRKLGDYQLFSKKWLDMAASLKRIGDITKMETEIEKDNEDATLWECDEIALRFLLEDGKLNLCLRNLVTFKDKQREMRRGKESVTMSLAGSMNDFEKGSGIMLQNAWKHVEAMQMTDFTCLMEHCANTINEVVINPDQIKGRDLTDLQEVLSIHYINSLLGHMEDIGEDRIMPIMAKLELLQKMLQFLYLHWKMLNVIDLIKACEVISMIFDSEDFSTHEDRYFGTYDDKKCLKKLYDDFIEDLTSDDREMRRKLRPMLDVIDDLDD